MDDLARAFSEVQSLPDEALAQELSNPTGMIPGYLILGELSDRKALRDSGGGQPIGQKRPSMAQELLQSFKPQPPQQPQGYSEGGLINRMNPFMAYLDQLQNPEAAGAMQQDAINDMFRGQPPLMPTQPAQGLQAAQHNSQINPMAPGQLQRPSHFSGGGLASLLR